MSFALGLLIGIFLGCYVRLTVRKLERKWKQSRAPKERGLMLGYLPAYFDPQYSERDPPHFGITWTITGNGLNGYSITRGKG